MPTTRTTRSSNPHERAARFLKASKIADALEVELRRATAFDPAVPEHWEAMIKAAEGLSQENWRKLSVLAGQRPASEKTQAAVLDVIRGRASAHAEPIESLFARLG